MSDANQPSPPAADEPPPLRSVHTNTFPQLLQQIGASVAVTTYQAGKLVMLRAEQRDTGPVLNTHFRGFNAPMGFAWEPGRLALGTKTDVWEFHDMPAVARKMETPAPSIVHDAAFLPRSMHVTGDIQIHEMLWVPSPEISTPRRPSDLWFINTRFSCLATRSGIYSFVPRWKPPFITALAPEDRCHLNGFCLRDNRLKYITALGATDKPGGWREDKPGGGIVMEFPSGEIIARGLSMPHSPRWHNNQLWILESGNGGVGIIDQKTGKYQEVTRLPGFTRGFDFAGPYAFIGLSQVRESAVFSGIKIAEMKQEDRCCGVWVIDTRTGQTVAYVKFMDALQEVFAVQILAGLRWPDVLSEDAKRVSESYELPDEALQLVPPELRNPSR